MTLLLGRADVERLLPAGACIEAVEAAFRDHALGKVPAPGILGMHAAKGGFHVKAGFLGRYFAATAVAAAVRIAVMEIESMMASGRPFAASNRSTAPWIVGSAVLPGKFALILAAK